MSIEVITNDKSHVHTEVVLENAEVYCPVCYSKLDLLPEDLSTEVSQDAITHFNDAVTDFLTNHNKFKQALNNYRTRKKAQIDQEL